MTTGVNRDPSISISSDGNVVYCLPTRDGSLVKELNLQNNSVQVMLSTGARVTRAFLMTKGALVCEAECLTPKGRPTTQIFGLRDGHLEPIFPSEESCRFGLCPILGTPVYIKSTRWAGPFAGRSWAKPYDLSQAREKTEIKVTSVAGVAATGGASSWNGKYPLLTYINVGMYGLSLVDTRDGHAVNLGAFPSPSSPALAPDGKQLALLQWRRGHDQEVIVIGVPSGRIVTTISLSRRATQVAYDGHGQLYCLECPANAEVASLLRLRGTQFEDFSSLK